MKFLTLLFIAVFAGCAATIPIHTDEELSSCRLSAPRFTGFQDFSVLWGMRESIHGYGLRKELASGREDALLDFFLSTLCQGLLLNSV